jgi:hypothetical protein
MWFLVTVVKGNKYYDADSQVSNRVLISDSSDMVIAGRSMGSDGYRFEARKGNESFVVSAFPTAQAAGSLSKAFLSLARQIGASLVPADA